MYGKYPSGHPLPIFWSPYPDDGVRESRDIEVGVTATFQVFRRHLLTDEEHLLQVPSINDSIGKEPACLILDGAEEYDFAVTVIVDNPLFITRHYRFNTNWANMLETENGGLMEGQHNPIRNYISFLQFNGSNPDLIELF
jgi:hypothetical protein